jgi:hypothetical protein
MLANDRLRLIRVKIERAYKHLHELEAAIMRLGELSLYSVSHERKSEAAKPSLKVVPVHVYGFEIPAIAGDVVHNLRSALDHLAFQLVSVGVESGEVRTENWTDIQFPIFHSPDGNEPRKRRCIQGARREAIEAIDALKPYKNGNPALWLLRNLDNTDKHSFVLLIGENAIVGGISLQINNPYFATLDIAKDNQDVNFTTHEAETEKPIVRPDALLPTLHKLAQLVSDIVTSFQPFLIR